MSTRDFHLVTEWRLGAPVVRIWDELQAVENWPDWWPAVRRVELLEDGDDHGVGAVRRMTWRTALAYEISYRMDVTAVEPMALIEGQASGDLRGTGRWTLQPDGQQTLVRFEWRVVVDPPWMRLLSPLLRPVFAWNHHKVMEWGRQGLERRLAE